MKKYILLLLFSVSLTIANSQPVKIAIISDVHFLSSEIAQPGTALEKFENTSGRNVTDLHAVLDKSLAEIEAAKTDILLILGDMANHGERQSHIGFIEKIKPLQQKGTRIFVIPGNHDINIPDSKKYIGETPQPTENVSADEFVQLYTSFGYADALKRDTASLSYLAEIDAKTWLLSFDVNRYSEYKTTSLSGGRVLPQTMEWALEILREAKARGIIVLGMMHHGVVEHLPFQAIFFPNHLVDDRKWVAETLADAGLKVILTGHFHANDITQLITANGNTIFDVETGSLSQYPFPYRLMTLEGDSLSIYTHFIDSIVGVPDLQGKYRVIMESFVRREVTARLRGQNFSITDETRDALIGLATEVNVQHAKGDEALNEDMLRVIKQFAEAMDGAEFDADSFRIDFPPEDNTLVIKLRE